MRTMISRRHTDLRPAARALALAALLAGVLALASPATGQPAEPAAPATTAAHGTQDEHAAAGDHAAENAHAGDGAHATDHGESVWVTLARVANFAILAGIIYVLARKPLAAHLESRGTRIRQDLVEAAAMKRTAAERLAEIETRMAALPAELEQMRARSAEELAAERARMRAAAEVERARLVEQARREIATQTRNARAQLSAHAAALAVDVAEARLRATLTPAEQASLVDRYASHMRTIQ